MENSLTGNVGWREKVVKTAMEYATYRWTPTEMNQYHGYDVDGILVNSPDIGYESGKYNCGWWQINQENEGLPYNWGGSSTIEDFRIGLAAGKYAGNVPDSRDNGISRYCIGVDCSGLITICWGLAERVVTKTIPNLAYPLDSIKLLLPGDIFLLPGSHVMIFINFTDDTRTYAQIIDATRKTGRVSLRKVNIDDLLNDGYKGYRKK